MPKRSELKHLNLYSCGIGDAGVKAIAEALSVKKGCALYTLNLSQNSFTDDGALALAQGMKDCVLETLEVLGNKYTKKGCDALKAAKPDATRMKHLSVTDRKK